MFHLHIESLAFPSLEAWYLPTWSLRKLETRGDLLTNQTIEFFCVKILFVLNVQTKSNSFDSLRHAKSSLTSTTGFISSTKVAVKGFPLLSSISGNNYRFLLLRLTSDNPKIQDFFFNMESSRFYKPVFPITTNLMSSFKFSVYCFLHELEYLIRKSLTL